jgi:hypothetical protein
LESVLLTLSGFLLGSRLRCGLEDVRGIGSAMLAEDKHLLGKVSNRSEKKRGRTYTKWSQKMEVDIEVYYKRQRV